ncbi:M14 family metallopeptidase [Deinococcus sp. SL84]|uniref:M14 family metallopeptidase n=1 Tax=Deinococcus sp. SL84 TaxID=2994663 RepID=UPI002276E1C6|nr:hypothetical protein [Deinococcus sp. SL84]MCY1703901.1 hypothetical protein [Deinococcus sp. SL84]
MTPQREDAAAASEQAGSWTWQGRTETAIVRHLLRKNISQPPRRLRVWISEGATARLRLQQELQERWPACDIEVLSCYKPLVSGLVGQLPAWESRAPQTVDLQYPVLEDAHPERFLLEAYPLAGWLRNKGAVFTSQPLPMDEPLYCLTVDGSVTEIPVPVRAATSVTGERVQRMTGRLVVDDQVLDFPTASEQLWEAYLGWLAEHEWPEAAPYFSALQVTARFPFERESLNYRHEALDLGEALSEEFYFGTQEFFLTRAAVPGQRMLQTGQIVPLVTSGDEVILEITLRDAQTSPIAAWTELPALASLERPLSSAEIMGWQTVLARGQETETRSVQGRVVMTFGQTDGSGSGMLVTAGQHANESTGVVAALRALDEIGDRSLLTVIPQENPDGYALFEFLREAQHPEHMHHAARYTALGDDLEYRQSSPWYEKGGRREAMQCHGPQVHVNLHGYPAHEWTRPMNGYIPQGFEAWTLPKGFFLILRAQPEAQRLAEDLADYVTLRLSENEALMTFNRDQCEVFAAHSSEKPYQMLHGTPCTFSERANLCCQIELITEFPDETVTGPDFLLGQQVQFAVIEAALSWLQTRQRMS